MTHSTHRWPYLNMRMVYPTAGIGNAAKATPLEVSIDSGIDNLTAKRENDEVLERVRSIDSKA